MKYGRYKKLIIGLILATLIVGFLLCGFKIVKRYTKEYYTMDDFASVTIGESTVYDVHLIAPVIKMGMTGYGGICEFPTEDGKYIVMRFGGSELVLFEIELSDESIWE